MPLAKTGQESVAPQRESALDSEVKPGVWDIVGDLSAEEGPFDASVSQRREQSLVDSGARASLGNGHVRNEVVGVGPAKIEQPDTMDALRSVKTRSFGRISNQMQG